MQTFAKIIFFLLFATIIHASNVNNISIPKNFTWSNCGPKNTNFLLPKNWHLKIDKHNSVYKIVISQEKSDNENIFTTGLSINVLKNVKKNTKLTPSQYAKRYINNFSVSIKYKTNGKPYSKAKSEKEGDFRIYTIRFIDDKSIMHHLLLANDKKDILYMILFEAPPYKWKQSWKKGKVILDNMIIDDDI